MTTDDSVSGARPRRATTADAAVVAQLLHDFNVEFSTPSPGPDALRSRLTLLLAGDDVVVLLVGEPASGLAVLSFRPNVWYEGPVAIPDELYVRPDLRGRGLGRALLDAACDLLRDRACTLMEINVDGEDTGARRFYEARGSLIPNLTARTRCCTTTGSSEAEPENCLTLSDDNGTTSGLKKLFQEFMLRGWQDRASAEQGGHDLADLLDATVMVVKVRPGH